MLIVMMQCLSKDTVKYTMLLLIENCQCLFSTLLTVQTYYNFENIVVFYLLLVATAIYGYMNFMQELGSPLENPAIISMHE